MNRKTKWLLALLAVVVCASAVVATYALTMGKSIFSWGELWYP